MAFVKIFNYVILVVLAVGAGFVINEVTSYPKVLGMKTFDNRVYWEKLVNDNPTYRDGYIKLSIINWQLGNKLEARVLVNKALEIDPNMAISPLLQQVLTAL